MTYATCTTKRRHTRISPRSFFKAMDIDESGMIIRVGIVCVVLLGFLYVSETNALMFLQRTMPKKEKTLLEVKNNVRTLEIQATQLAASQTVQEAALSHAMVLPRDVSYVNGGDSAVAMATPSSR